MTDIKTPAHYYVFEVCPEGAGPGRLLQHGPALDGLSPSRCSALVPQATGYGVETLTMPPCYATAQGHTPMGQSARVTCRPWRETLGTGERVKDCRPWLVFIDGIAVRTFERQSKAVSYCRGRGFDVPMLVQEDGTPWD